MKDKLRMLVRKWIACVLAALLVVGLMPVLPEAPYALASELEVELDGVPVQASAEGIRDVEPPEDTLVDRSTNS